MRNFFIVVTIIFCILCTLNISICAEEDREEISTNAFLRLSNGVWISEDWINLNPSSDNVNIYKNIHITFNDWNEEVQPYLKKSWNEYKNINLIFYPSQSKTTGSFLDCGSKCFVDNNLVLYARYTNESKEHARKYILTPDGKMIYNGVTYILVPFDQFDEYYAKYIEPGPDGKGGASAYATATVGGGAVAPPTGADQSPQAPNQAMSEEDRYVKEVWEREVKAAKQVQEALKKHKPAILDPNMGRRN